MNKNTAKAIKQIEEAKRIQAETIAAADAEIKATREKLTSLKAELEAAKSAEEYTRLCQAMRDTESALEFFTTRSTNAKRAPITPADYKEIRQYISQAYEEVSKSSIADIEAEALKLFALIAAHDAEMDKINKAREGLSTLYPEANSTPYMRAISSSDIRVREILSAYYRIKNSKVLLAKAGVNV